MSNALVLAASVHVIPDLIHYVEDKTQQLFKKRNSDPPPNHLPCLSAQSRAHAKQKLTVVSLNACRCLRQRVAVG
jgi:hypothetical protein